MDFWLIAAALSAIALAFVVPPFFRRGPNVSVERGQVNVAIYKERLEELEQQGQGLTDAQKQQAKQELEKNLADDLNAAEEQSGGAARAGWAGIVVAVCIPLLAVGGYYFSSEAEQQFAQAGKQHPLPLEQQENLPSVEEMAEKLRHRLEQEPDNAEGWEMMARSMLVLERYADANIAYDNIIRLKGRDNADLLSDYAESMAMANDSLLEGEPDKLIKEALALNPQHPKSLWLAGMSAAQQNRFEAAADYWQRLLALLPKDSEDYKSVSKHLNEVKQLAGGDMPVQSEATVPAQTAQETDKTANAQIQVNVSLSPELQAQTKPEHTVFVYARAAEGPRMPLAIVKKQVKDLPLQLVLDDSMSMMPAMSLSKFSQVIVAARISPSGAAMPQSGDFNGESAPINPLQENAPVNITINTVLP